jgi:hypothetical protein
VIHNTHFSQYIPPTLFHCVTGTWTLAAGVVTDTIVKKVNDANQTSTVNIPVLLPSNSIALQGAKLASVEIDYEITGAALEEVTAVFNKVTRGADGAVAVVAAQTFAYDLGHDTAAERYDVDQHKMTLTLGTLAAPVPVWVDNDEYFLIELTVNQAGDTGVIEFLGAVANFTLKA